MKKAFKIFWTVVMVIAALLFAICMLIQTPGVQTFVAKKVTASLEEKIDGRIEFSKIHLKPFNALILKDVVLIDNNPPVSLSGEVLDTLAKARSIVTTFSLKGLFRKQGLHLGRVSVTDAAFTFVNEPEGNNLSRFFGLKSGDKDKEKDPGHVFDASKVTVNDFRFRFVNLKSEKEPKAYGIDWSDLDITVHSLSGRSLSLAHGYMKGVVEDASATEKSGYHIKSLSGKTRVGHGMTFIGDVHLTDDWSVVNMPEYSMTYLGTESFKDFIDEVRITGSLVNTRLAFKSLSYFVPSFKDMGTVLNVSKGSVDGTVSDLGINSLEFKEAASGVSGTARGRIAGLPDTGRTVLDFDVQDLGFTLEGIGSFIKGFSPGTKADLSRFAPGERLWFDGKVHGTLDDLALKGKLGSLSVGSLQADLRMKDLVGKGSVPLFSGNMSTDRLDLGKITGVDKLGEVTMRGVLNASFGGGKANVRIDTLFVDKLHALGYDYSNIVANGTYTDQAFDGRLVCNDPNLNLLFQGIFTLSDKTRNGLYKFYANVGYADLQALGLDKRGMSKVSGRVNANYMTVSKSSDIIGDLDVLDLNLDNSSGAYDIGDIRIRSHSNNNVHRMNLSSSFADGTYVGTKPLTSILNDVKELTVQRELPLLLRDTARTWNGDSYDVKLDFHDSRDLLAFVSPGLYIADSTKLRLSVSGGGDVKATLKSGRVALKKNYLRNLDFAFDNRDGSLNGVLTGSELAIGGLLLKNNNITLYGKDNHVGIGCFYDNRAELTDKGEIYLSGEFGRSPENELLIHCMTLPSDIWFNDEDWSITPCAIEIAGKNIKLDNLTAASNGQSIRFDGGFSTTDKDTLTVEMVKFDMGLVNRFLGDDFGIAGLATGHGRLTSPLKDNGGLLLSLLCDSVSVAGSRVGTLHLGSSMDETGKLHLVATNDLDGSNTLRLSGDYFTRQKSLDFSADLNGMDAGYLAPLLSSVFSETGGRISGKVRVSGETDNLSVQGEGTRFDNVRLKVAFTNVPYFADGPFSIGNNGLVFEDIALRDRYDGTGTLSGGILFNHLKDFRMDTRIRMEAIDLDDRADQAFYGNLFATGDISITGPFNSIQLDVNARTDKNGTLHIPIDNASKEGGSDLLTFKEAYREVYVDPYDVMMNRLVSESRKEQDFRLRLKVNANQNTEAFVEIDRAAGNVLNGRGRGNLDIAVRPSRDLFTIKGDYTLNSGNFHFNAMDIAQRDFTLTQGSSIRFNGDVMDSDLDINGVYTTKASVATLIADTSSVAARRTVNCGIGISGKLREPQLTFSVDVPDLDPTTKSKVESALNTEDKVQRQFLSLLLSGNFMPDEQSGVVNNTNNLYSNLAEIMAGQLNSILQKLDIPLDFGLNYQSNDSGTNIFDVAVSTQLFNNRVIVNGNVGNREYGNSAGGADVVGDIDIEIKLDRPGQVRLNLFSHSADAYSTYLDNTQRNGVGITYQREFNTFKEFFRSLVRGRRRRDQNRPAGPPPQPIREMNTITISQ